MDSVLGPVGNGIANIPFGTTLNDAKTKIEEVLKKKVPGRTIANFKWKEKFDISDDDEMNAVQDGHEVIVLLQ